MSQEDRKARLINDMMSRVKFGGGDDQIQSMSMQDMLDQKSADQEVLTFDFLQEVIVANVGEDEWQEITLEKYHENKGQIKATFSMVALNFLTHEKREQLQLEVWTAPYGFFYMWQFAVNGLRYYNKEGLSSVLKYLEPLVEDMENNLDYGRFNHFGRILATAKFLVYSALNKNEVNEEIQKILFGKLMSSVHEQKNDKLSKGASGENNGLNANEVEACEMSIRVLDTLWQPLLSSSFFYYLDPDKFSKGLEGGIQETLKFVEELKSEDWTGERTKLFADIEKDLNDMLEHIQPKEELSTEDVMSQLEELMNQLKEANPEAYTEIEKQAKEITEPTKESEVDLNVNMELSTAMWQAGRYTSFHEWLGDYPEGSPNYNNLHDNMIPKYKATKETFENGTISGRIAYKDFANQLNEALSGYAIDGGEYTAEEVETLMSDLVSEDSTKFGMFNFIKHYPEFVYQCGVVSASFDNGCLSDAPEAVVKHCERWGFVMTKKIEIFNDIALTVLKNFKEKL